MQVHHWVMGSARAVYQFSVDGDFPKVFGHLNKHGVPDVAMTVNVVAGLAIMLFSSPATIYVFSNVGYLISFTPVLIAFWLLRRNSPEHARPFRLPNWMVPVAPVLAAIFFLLWIVGGPLYSANQASAGWAYWIGWLVLLTYLPLYYWRKAVEDRRVVVPAVETPTQFA